MSDLLGDLAVAALFNRAAAWLFGLALAVFVIGFIGYLVGSNETLNQAHERGYVEFCKADGSRVWLGECSATPSIKEGE